MITMFLSFIQITFKTLKLFLKIHFLTVKIIFMCLHVCKYSMYMSGVPRSRKRVSDSLELQSQMGVSHPVDAEN